MQTVTFTTSEKKLLNYLNISEKSSSEQCAALSLMTDELDPKPRLETERFFPRIPVSI